METKAKTKREVVVPSSVRRKLGVKAGTRTQVEVDQEKAEVIRTPIKREFIYSLRGKFRGAGLVEELEASRSRDREREEKDVSKYESQSLRWISEIWIDLVETDIELTHTAAMLKAKDGISYADRHAAAAKHHNATLLTGDQEFKQLENEITIVWL